MLPDPPKLPDAPLRDVAAKLNSPGDDGRVTTSLKYPVMPCRATVLPRSMTPGALRCSKRKQRMLDAGAPLSSAGDECGVGHRNEPIEPDIRAVGGHRNLA